MNEYERAREAIDHLIVMAVSKYELNNTEFYADAILALPMICVKADEQSCSKTLLLGGNSYHLECLSCGLSAAQFIHALHDEGFVRIAKREE